LVLRLLGRDGSKIFFMETRIKKIQTAIFTRNFNVTDDTGRAQLLIDINAHTSSIFNVPPVQVPIPSDAPPEFPRIILNSTGNVFNCNISLMRTDIFYNIPSDNADNLEILLATQKNNTENIFNFLINRGIIVSRIGFIVDVIKELSSEEGNGHDYLRNKFISDDRFQDPKELMFRYNKADRSDNFDINNLITITGKPSNKIILQTDINTVAEIMNTANFNLDNFNEIIDYGIQKTKGLIDNFPNI